jgi:hypothetical protein
MSESEKDQLNRNLDQLLQELRVALPGVQVLFAFLLTVPFATGFKEVTPREQDVYFATLILAAVATALLIAPSMHHRILFHQEDKRHLIAVANVLMIAGLTALASSITLAIGLVTSFLFGSPQSWIATGVAASSFALVWYALPLQRRLRGRHSNLAPDGQDPR